MTTCFFTDIRSIRGTESEFTAPIYLRIKFIFSSNVSPYFNICECKRFALIVFCSKSTTGNNPGGTFCSKYFFFSGKESNHFDITYIIIYLGGKI